MGERTIAVGGIDVPREAWARNERPGLVFTVRRGGKAVTWAVGLLGAWGSNPRRVRRSSLLELPAHELGALASMSHVERRAIARLRVPTAWRHLANLHAWGYLRADLRRWTEQAHRAARVLRGGRP